MASPEANEVATTSLLDLLEAHCEESSREADRRTRSWRTNALVTAAVATAAAVVQLPAAQRALVPLTAADVSCVAVVGWVAYELATVAHHLLGGAHLVARVFATLDQFARHAALLALVFLSGSASSPLWVVVMAASYILRAKPRARAQRELGVLVAAFFLLCVAFLIRGHDADAWMSFLVFLGCIIGRLTTARLAARAALARVERDALERSRHALALRKDRARVARELHDGVGADVMALVLRLRRAAKAGRHPGAADLAARAEGLLDELRGVVWTLRNEQGTISELGKLVDATCRAVSRSAAYERMTPPESALVHVDPRAALEVLEAARELVTEAAARDAVTRLRLTLQVSPAHDGLTLTLATDTGRDRERTIAFAR